MSQNKSILVRTTFRKGYSHEEVTRRANSEESTLLCSANAMLGNETYTAKPVTLYERTCYVSFDSVAQMKRKYPSLEKYAEVYNWATLEQADRIQACFRFQVDQEQEEFLNLVGHMRESLYHSRSAVHHNSQVAERAKLERIIREHKQVIDNYESMWSVKIALFFRKLFN